MRTKQLFGLDAKNNPLNVKPINSPDARNGILFPRGSRRTTRPGMAKQNVEANGNPIMFMAEIHSDDCNTDTALAIAGGELQTLPFPVNIPLSSRNLITGQDATYSVARSTATGFSTANQVGQLRVGDYAVTRAFTVFDTSSIPDDATIVSVQFKALFTLAQPIDNSFDVRIHQFNWDSPISAGNQEANYDGALASDFDNIWINTLGKSQLTFYTSPNLDTSWINKTGDTKYSLLSSRDVSNTPPADNEFEFLTTAGDTLIVQYTL